MDLKKLPPSLLVALGLGCGPTVADDDEAAEGSATATDSGMTTTACLIAPETVGPCLDAPLPTTSGFTTGPCLDGVFSTTMEVPGTTGTDSTTGTGPGPGTGTGTGGATDTNPTGPDTATSVCLSGIAPDPADARFDGREGVRERLIEAGVLPADVAKRLEP